MEQTEQKYTWEDFKKEEIYQSLLDFFGEFSGDINDTVIFVSRKSYCLFLLLREKNEIRVGSNPIYVDRLIMKSYKPEFYRGETVYLVDDTISTGSHLAEVCREVIKRTDYKKIILKVFAKEKQFDEDEYVAQNFADVNKVIMIETKIEMETSQKLRFSSIETLIYHQENIPYFIELPYLAEDNVSDLDYVTLQEEEYRMLQRSRSWKFYKCDQSGYRQNLIENAVIVMENGFSNLFPEFIYDFVIRVQIVTNPDKTRNVIFSPFAILKSVRFEELEGYFFDIFRGTEYAQSISRQKGDLGAKYEFYHYKALYRAVVYVFSYYIGLQFIDFLDSNVIHRKLVFQRKNDKFCYEKMFIEAVDEIFVHGSEKFFLPAFLYKGFTNVEMRNSIISLFSSIGKYGRLESDFRTTYHYLWALFNDLREDASVKNTKNESLRKFLSIEELQNAVSLSCFTSDYEIKDVLTCSICCMLEQSKISNEITYDEEKRVIYRGFKYAENSEAVFDVAEKAFYAAASSYLKKVHEDNYEKKYKKFLSVLKEFFIHNRLLGSVITMDEFQIYSEFYRRQSNKKKMERLEFLIENKIPTYIKGVSDHIDKIDWNDL